MVVYRVEDDKGQGPYRNDFKTRDLFPSMKFHYLDPLKPIASKDFNFSDVNKLLDDDNKSFRDFYFAFPCMKMLYRWFGGLIKLFYKKTQLRIVKYEVDDKYVIFGKSGFQVCFLKSKATKI